MSTPADNALLALGKATGIARLAFDADGLCRLGLDDLTVDLQRSGDGKRLLLSSLAGEIDPARAAETMARLLAANAFFSGTGGATIGVPAGSTAVILAREVDCDAPDRLPPLLDAFVDACHAARRLLTPAEQAPAPDTLNLMRV